jgi:hypothetical protein
MPTKLKPGSKVIPFGKKGYVAFSPAMVKLASYVADNILRGGFTKEELARIEAGEVDLDETPLVESAVNTRKFVMMARALPGLLNNARPLGADLLEAYPNISLGRLSEMSRSIGAKNAALLYKQLDEIDPKFFKALSKIKFEDLPEGTAGVYKSPIKTAKIDPRQAAKMTVLDKANVPAHELTHAMQFTNESQSLSWTKLLGGKAIRYADRPIEVHARAVEYSRKPMIEAYENVDEFMGQFLRDSFDRELDRLSGLSTDKAAEQIAGRMRVFALPKLREEVRDLIQKGVLSAGGATAGVQILNNPRKKTD